MLARFAIHQPATVAEACGLLDALGPEATVYAGGTELLVIMKERLAAFSDLVDIKHIPGLSDIHLDGDTVVIGPLATHRVIERHPLIRDRLPLLAALEANVANIRVRSTGTIGGNLCFAEPHSDPATLLVAWGARFTLISSRGEREIDAAGFFTGLLETARAHDEILTAIRVPIPTAHTVSAYERFKIHERPTATVAVTLTVADGAIAHATIVAGSVCERPIRLGAAEALLAGAPLDASAFARAADAAQHEIEPTVDQFESTDYKRHLVGVLTRRALTQAAGQTIRRSA